MYRLPRFFMIKKNIRLRKEYLYKKSIEEKENKLREKKKLLKNLLTEGKPIDPKDRDLELSLRNKFDLEDENSLKPQSIVDDEYAFAGVKDPKILLSTCRDPSNRLIQFLKELNLLFPNSYRINRGSLILNDIVSLARRQDVSDIIVVHEHRGNPDSMIISHLPLGPTIYFSIQDVVLRHDLPKKPHPMSLVAPHLIFENFSAPLGMRISNILKHLFPPAAPLGQRVMSFTNHYDIIHFRHYVWSDDRLESSKAKHLEKVYEDNKHKKDESTTPVKIDENHQSDQEKKNTETSKKKKKEEEEAENNLSQIKLNEVGPRFSLKPYKIELGTLEMKDCDIEWCLKPFLNKSKTILA